jgi:hypothetical protein
MPILFSAASKVTLKMAEYVPMLMIRAPIMYPNMAKPISAKGMFGEGMPDEF